VLELELGEVLLDRAALLGVARLEEDVLVDEAQVSGLARAVGDDCPQRQGDARPARDGMATMATLGVRSRSLKRSLASEFPLNHAP
jgi:hypothetical protein